MPARPTVVLGSLLLAAPAVIFWFWLVIRPTRVELICPEECSCETEGYYVNCSGSELKSIPLNIPTHVRKLLLDNNRITYFENDSFVSRGLVELETISADFCKIGKIGLGAFNGLTMLRQLSMLGNEISEIIPGTFEKVDRLENLRLDHNRIDQLDSDTFYGLVNLKNLSLDGNKLQYLHPDMFVGLPNIQFLFLSNNIGLEVPNDGHFINSHSLKYLFISACNVSSVSVGTFANVSALELLDLSYNNLRSLDINILKVLRKLSELNLSHNEISEIIPSTLENFSHLKYLHLHYNKIEHLESDIFYGLVELKYIDLEGNKLQHLHPDTFVGLQKLKKLFLSFNYDLQIPTDGHFINSHSLKFIDISDCNISSVSVEIFANVSGLERFDLSYNNLRSVDINILKGLPELSEFYLQGNPLQCDCQLQEVWRWCQDHNIQTAYEALVPKCATPSEVEGMWWGVLEKGQCLQGNIQYYGDYKNISYYYTPTEDTDTETEEEESISKFVKRYELPIYAVLFIFGTTGNVILIIIIICNKDMRTVPNMYILNLAVSDIIYVTVLLSEACAKRFPDVFVYGDIMCTLHTFCYRMSVGLSAYSVAVLSIHRYRVTVYPLHFRVFSPPTWRGTGATICGVWIVAALFAIPASRLQYLCSLSIFLLITKYYQPVIIFELLVSCVFPVCVTVFCYIMTARHLVESSSSILEETQNPRLITRKNTAKVVLGLTVVFIISYLPYHISETCFYSMVSWENVFSPFHAESWINNLLEIQPFLKQILLINSCLNPVAVFCTSLAFRRQLKRYCCCFCKINSPRTEFELIRRN